MAYIWDFVQRMLFGEIQDIDFLDEYIGTNNSASIPLSKEHRNSLSDIPITIARPRPRSDSVESAIRPDEDPAIRCLKERRRYEKIKLAGVRQELESLIEFYKISKSHAPRLELILKNDPQDPTAAVAMAKESNQVFLRTILDDVEHFSDKILTKVEDLSPDQRSVVTPRNRSRIQQMNPLQRAETAMDLLDDLARERHHEALYVLGEKLQEDVRKDSALEITM